MPTVSFFIFYRTLTEPISLEIPDDEIREIGEYCVDLYGLKAEVEHLIKALEALIE